MDLHSRLIFLVTSDVKLMVWRPFSIHYAIPFLPTWGVFMLRYGLCVQQLFTESQFWFPTFVVLFPDTLISYGGRCMYLSIILTEWQDVTTLRWPFESKLKRKLQLQFVVMAHLAALVLGLTSYRPPSGVVDKRMALNSFTWLLWLTCHICVFESLARLFIQLTVTAVQNRPVRGLTSRDKDVWKSSCRSYQKFKKTCNKGCNCVSSQRVFHELIKSLHVYL